MASFTTSFTTAVVDGEEINLIDATRSNCPRSALIAVKVQQARTDWEEGNLNTFAALIEEYIPLDLMDLAMTTFHLLRIPFQTRRPFGDSYVGCLLPNRVKFTNAWNIFSYFTDTFGNWNKFREFLELADKIQQLATAYCCVPNPDIFWVRMDNLWVEANTPVSYPVGDDGLNEPLTPPRRRIAEFVRGVLLDNLEHNPPGSPPRDSDGDLIDPALFQQALRMNWEEERGQRACHLLELHRQGTVDISESRPLLRQWKDSWTPINEFHWSVLRTRGISICSGLNLDEAQEARLLNQLQWNNTYELGVQAYALCLPQQNVNYYDPRFLAQMTRNRRQVLTFLEQMDREDDNFSEGWFQRYPAALPPLRG